MSRRRDPRRVRAAQVYGVQRRLEALTAAGDTSTTDYAQAADRLKELVATAPPGTVWIDSDDPPTAQHTNPLSASPADCQRSE